ncbi:unnamed protein product [Pleuronectes platessa]|uniref:Fibronectin type-III domain-containing protein n=1 Tax=Pleuronectes platessa TaxID=8262 RepID=A0A9N7YAR5_PLEPL|nr:unnamed protein product [Pleuronectes platessa]
MLREEAPSAPPKNIVASGRTNQSIMVQWQPPPEPQLNGVLRGYVLRYRLAGLPGDYQEKNISSPETNYCLLKDLIIWTQYQIQVPPSPEPAWVSTAARCPSTLCRGFPQHPRRKWKL